MTVFIPSTARGRDPGDLHRVLREREPGLHAGARRRLARRHPGIPDAVHLAEGSDIREPDVGAHDALLAAAGLGQQLIDLAHNLRRLPPHIAPRVPPPATSALASSATWPATKTRPLQTTAALMRALGRMRWMFIGKLLHGMKTGATPEAQAPGHDGKPSRNRFVVFGKCHVQ